MNQRRFARYARTRFGRLAALICVLAAGAPAAAQTPVCDNPNALGVGRTIEIDTSNGGIYGSLSPHASKTSLLGKKEVVLTFDDGPMPWITRSILDTLDKQCTKATFFSVGRMAVAYPATVRDVISRGHTLGTHTFSHPFNMPRMKPEKAELEIENGFAAVAAATGAPIAPFFRFPGLSDSADLISYLGSRGMAAFTVDIVSNDSYIHSPGELARRTVAAIEARQGGIVLFHDIKSATAKALPDILVKLKARGYTVVHFTAKAPAQPKLELLAHYAQRIEKDLAGKDPAGKLPFYGKAGPVTQPANGTAGAQPQNASETAGSSGVPQYMRGGLDLSQKPNEEHPAATSFPGGVPSAATPSGILQGAKGAIWDAVKSWNSEILAPHDPNAPHAR